MSLKIFLSRLFLGQILCLLITSNKVVSLFSDLIHRTLCHTDKDCNTVARILNCEQTTLALPRGTKIERVNEIDVEKSCEPLDLSFTKAKKLDTVESTISSEQLQLFATDYGFKINPDLLPNQREELLRLLYKYRACFARSLVEIRRYKNYELELTLKDTKPCYRRQYKLSKEDSSEVHRQIDEMRACGIIEPSTTSVYHIPICTVRISNGACRAV